MTAPDAPRRPLGAFLLLAAGALSGLLLAPALGQQRPGLVKGGGSAGVEKEPTFRFNTAEGRPTQSDCDRNLIKVPPGYGQAFAVTLGTKNQPVIWFRGDDGSVRNVILADDQSLVRVVPGS